MPAREDVVALLTKALQGEDKPLTSQRVIEVARLVLSPPLADQFITWFGPNGARLLENLNGHA
jgi:hypothetical protein